MTYAELFSYYEKKLEAVGEEAEALTYVFREVKNWTLTDIILQRNQEVSEQDNMLLKAIFMELSAHVPAQHITGKAYFHGMTLEVDSRVLIPRPETEELVDLILMENSRADLSVLDIGTGSGAIAISLANSRKDWQISASDISTEALEVAEKNAQKNAVSVTFLQSDIFSNISGRFDLIISNPPYIAWADKDEVSANVFQAEPHNALFADEDGYAVYRRIITEARPFLKENGKIYFEIGYKQGQEVQRMLSEEFKNSRIRVLKDSSGKDRMVVMDNG